MKLATKKGDSPDGVLHLVSRDLSHSVEVTDIAPTLQAALDDWNRVAPKLEEIYHELNEGKVPGANRLDSRTLASPLPRAWQWLDGSAFHSHGDLLEQVFGIEPPKDKHTIPLMYQGAGDDLLGPCDDVPLPSEDDGMDFEAEIAVIVDRVPMGISAADAERHIRLLTIANDTSLRAHAVREMKTGFGWIHAKPATTMGPVAVTPDELGDSWRDGRVHLPLLIHWNGKEFGRPNAGAMGFSFGQLVAHAAYSRNLCAGTVIGSGTVSNETYREVGSACIAERRAIELLDEGEPKTGFMKFGDRVRIEMLDPDGKSIFGAIDQQYVQAQLP